MFYLDSPRRDSRPGSAAYARELADFFKGPHHDLGPTDAGIVADALLARAARGHRRGMAIVAAYVLVVLALAIEHRGGIAEVVWTLAAGRM